MSCYIHSDGTFDLESDAVVVMLFEEGVNLYNVGQKVVVMIFHETMRKSFSNLFNM